jgi:hypothetical protein
MMAHCTLGIVACLAAAPLDLVVRNGCGQAALPGQAQQLLLLLVLLLLWVLLLWVLLLVLLVLLLVLLLWVLLLLLHCCALCAQAMMHDDAVVR